MASIARPGRECSTLRISRKQIHATINIEKYLKTAMRVDSSEPSTPSTERTQLVGTSFSSSVRPLSPPVLREMPPWSIFKRIGNVYANANVTRARYKPLIFNAGRPTRAPPMKQTTKTTGSVIQKSQRFSLMRIAVVYAPRPVKAMWPRESRPDQPIAMFMPRIATPQPTLCASCATRKLGRRYGARTIGMARHSQPIPW